MLGVLAAQVGLGLFSVDEDSVAAGPLSKFVSFDTGRVVAHQHAQLFWLLIGLVGLHLAAIGVYALRRKDLVGPMVTGAAPPRRALKQRPPGADLARSAGRRAGRGRRLVRCSWAQATDLWAFRRVPGRRTPGMCARAAVAAPPPESRVAAPGRA